MAPTRINAGVIRRHYDVGEDFHLCFLDAKYHLYSTLIFDVKLISIEPPAAEAKPGTPPKIVPGSKPAEPKKD